MIDDNRVLNVLYFEDEPGNFDSRARIKYKLEVDYALNEDMGLSILSSNTNKWDAIILDAKMPKSEYDVEEISTLMDTLMKVSSITGDHIPYFIYSAHGSLLESLCPCKPWQDKAAYDKSMPESFDKLCTNIRRAVFENRDEKAVIKKKYPLINLIPKLPCEPPSEQRLYEIIRCVEIDETIDYNPNTDETVFNQIRIELEWMFRYLYHLGINSVVATHTNIAACSNATCEMEEYVPKYIQRALHSLTVICNDGSHGLPTNLHTESGLAPYLVKSTVFQFLSVLHWILGIQDSPEHNAARQEKASKLKHKHK